jgi:hypothetical protein
MDSIINLKESVQHLARHICTSLAGSFGILSGNCSFKSQQKRLSPTIYQEPVPSFIENHSQSPITLQNGFGTQKTLIFADNLRLSA